ncbi:MAG: Tc toxin subunit A [Caldilineaceae bacterium]
MNKVIFPLTDGMEGQAVADLQAALRVLLERNLLDIDPGEQADLAGGLQLERASQVYKGATVRLVELVQERRGLAPENFGQVDAVTADAINAILQELGLLDEGAPGWTQVAEALAAQHETLRAINAGTDHLAQMDERLGALQRPPMLALNMRGAAVAALHEQLRQIGVVLPAQETAESIFGSGTQSALLQFQTKQNLAQTGSFDAATRNALAIAVSNAAHLSRVEGRIFTETGLPAANIKLRIVNRGFGDAAPLLGEGEIETDERGFYALPYTDATANIEIHALAADGTTVKLSQPKVNADRAAVINLVAPASVQSQANEWQLLARDLTTVVGADMGRLAQARENGEGRDLSLLHEATQWDARLIASAAIAAKATAATGIEQEALYGALRAGLPADGEALAAVSREAFAGALAQANTAGIIALDENRMTAALDTFDTFRLETRGKLVVPGALSSMGEMLAMATIDTEQLDKFKQLALLHDGDDAQLWQDAEAAGIPPAQISTLQLQGKLAYLTLNNAPLTAALQTEIGTPDQLAQLVEKDLYQQAAWVTRLNRMAKDDPDSPTELTEAELARLAQLIPSAYSQPTIAERRDAYAADMARMVRQSFPTQVVQRMIGKDELTLGAEHDALKAPVQTFLQQAVGQGFQIGRTPVESFIQQNRDALFAGVAEHEQVLAETGVKLLTRAYQMTPSDRAMTTLLDLGFTSARQVTAIDRITFVERYGERFGSRQEAEAVWDKSKQITSVTYNLRTLGQKVSSEPPLWAISGSPQAHTAEKTALKGVLKAYPTMESLFGSQDFCECEHCRSVLSPAAYLVDLLRFVDPSPEDWQHTLTFWKKNHNNINYGDPPYNFLMPYDALIARRPDIPHLPLTCENTNVALPYIDLVNEILEYYVQHKGLDEHAVHDTGEATSAELLAEPNNLIPEAYDTLKAAQFPLTLPFDLWLETVRRFCAYFERPLWQLLDVFRPNESLFPPDGAYTRAAVFAEYLGIPTVEYELYTGEIDLAELYGYPGQDTPTIIAHLQSAKTLSRRLGSATKRSPT